VLSCSLKVSDTSIRRQSDTGELQGHSQEFVLEGAKGVPSIPSGVHTLLPYIPGQLSTFLDPCSSEPKTCYQQYDIHRPVVDDVCQLCQRQFGTLKETSLPQGNRSAARLRQASPNLAIEYSNIVLLRHWCVTPRAL